MASKSAVHGMMRWIAKAGAPHGVYANTSGPRPGGDRHVGERSRATAPSGGQRHRSARRYGNAEDIAQAALFLCSPASNWITGTSLDISGGMWMD